MGIDVLDRRAVPGIGGPDVVQAVLLTLGDLDFGRRITPQFVAEAKLCRMPPRPKRRRLLSAYAARTEGKGFNVVYHKLLVCGELMPPVGSCRICCCDSPANISKFGVSPQMHFAAGDG